MAWFRVHLTEEQQRIVNEERLAHPDLLGGFDHRGHAGGVGGGRGGAGEQEPAGPVALAEERRVDVVRGGDVGLVHDQRRGQAVAHVVEAPVDDVLLAATAKCIADARVSPEGREGIAAFLEKRAPAFAGR